MSRFAAIHRAVEAVHLRVAGALHEDGDTVILLGPAANFWTALCASPEWLDGDPDPVDRWSRRVICALAGSLEGAALFPFGGPPYQPFLRWAQQSGHTWQSPVGMLVHDRMGLWVSYRGALRMGGELPLPAPAIPPCTTCADRPCATACPVNALSAERGYDVAACHGFLETEAGQDCLSRGCKARRACPVSRAFGRDAAQSAYHMAQFHPVKT